jgi:hypothetical protein
LANIVRQKAPPSSLIKKGKGKKMSIKYASSEDDEDTKREEDSDEELIVDDLDDLLETMSPLSEHSSNESDNSLLGSEEFFTDDDDSNSDMDQNGSDVNIGSSVTMSPYTASYASSVHLDSGDDEDIEDVETQKIIKELTLDSDEEADDMDSDILDEEGGVFVEDEYDEEEEDEEDIQSYYARNNSHWSSSSEEEEEEEFDYTTAVPSDEDVASMDSADDDKTNPLLPLLDSEGNLYDSIAAAFMQALVPMGDNNNAHGDTTTGANTPVVREDYQLSAFELTNALSALSAETSRQHNDILLRRPSLPSNAVSAARRMRGSQDFSTSEALRALSALVSDDLSLALQPIDEVEDISEDNKQQGESATSNTVNDETSTSDILPTQLALSLSTDLNLQEQILDILQGGSSSIVKEIGQEKNEEDQQKVQSTFNTTTNNHNNITETTTSTTTTTSTSTTTATSKPIYSSRQILPKPSGSGSFLPSSTISTSASTLEQQIQEALIQSLTNNSNKRKATNGLENEKKRRSSRSNSLGSNANQQHLQQLETTSFSTPASPAAIIDELEDINIQIDNNNNNNEHVDIEIDDFDEEEDGEENMAVSMDDLVDTSQLYTRSSSRSPSPEIEDTYSRDLSRWQRIPIGAFRLMRSKNKLWLER